MNRPIRIIVMAAGIMGIEAAADPAAAAHADAAQAGETGIIKNSHKTQNFMMGALRNKT